MRVNQSLTAITAALLAILGQACSHGMVIETEPDGAEIVLNGKPVGATPLTLDASALPARGNLRIAAEKKGHGVVNTYLPNPLETGSSQRVLILIPKQEAELSKINRHTSLVMRAHRLYLQKRSYEARNLLEEALLENPRYLYPHLLSGAIFFMNQEYDKSKEAYKKALEIDPDNSDAKQMLKIIANRPAETGPKVNGPEGARQPASAGNGAKTKGQGQGQN